MKYDDLFTWRLGTLSAPVTPQLLVENLSVEQLPDNQVPLAMVEQIRSFRKMSASTRLRAAQSYYVRGCPGATKVPSPSAKPVETPHHGSTLQSLLAELGEVEAVRVLTQRKLAIKPPPPPIPEKGLQFEYCECGCHGHTASMGAMHFWIFQEFKNGEITRAVLRQGHGWSGSLLGQFDHYSEAVIDANKRAEVALRKLVEDFGGLPPV